MILSVLCISNQYTFMWYRWFWPIWSWGKVDFYSISTYEKVRRLATTRNSQQPKGLLLIIFSF